MSRIYAALVHHPVRDRAGATVTTAVTNLDVHDLARSARTYGLAGYFVVTPIDAQRALVGRILEHWGETGSGKKRMPERSEALGICRTVDSLETAAQAVAEAHGGLRPRTVVTAARLPDGSEPVPYQVLRERMGAGPEPWIVLFGTGHGLAESALREADCALPSIRPATYNHLSVRAAAAITLDRLFGDAGADELV